MATIRDMLEHARKFTATERVTLRVWFDLDQAGKEVDADRFLNSGLMLEHFQSLMPSDPAQVTPEMLEQESQLRQDFQNELDLAQTILHERISQTIVNGPMVTETRSYNR